MSNCQIICDNEEEFECMKSRAIKLRTILLERQNKKMFCNLSTFNPREKTKFINELSKMWNEMSDSEIDEEFNSIVNDSLFHAGKDVSEYPVQYKGMPDHSILYEPESGQESKESKTSYEVA